VTALLAQYRECSAQHIASYSLTWQGPAVTVAITGFLAAAAFGYDVPAAIRTVVAAVGALFVLAMTVAVERNRMMQLRRRRDMVEIERRLAPLGVAPIVWDVSQISREVRSGEFPVHGFPVARFEFFRFLRALMYVLIGLLLALACVSLADVFAADILS
jgi:hypothetical protein